MFSKQNERAKLIIPQIKSRQGSRSKVQRTEPTDNNDYGTDPKRIDYFKKGQHKQQNVCLNCKQISTFATKKPSHLVEKAIQTTHKTFLIDLIQEKIHKICQKNTKLTNLLQQKQQQIIQRQQQIAQIQQKFTSILLSLSQQVATARRQSTNSQIIAPSFRIDSDTPSFIKALHLDRI